MRSIFIAISAFLCLIGSVQSFAESYMLVDVKPFRKDALSKYRNALTNTFGTLEDYGADSFYTRTAIFGVKRAMPPIRLIPFIREKLPSGRSVWRRMDATPVTVNGAHDPCLGAFFCAFKISDEEAAKFSSSSGADVRIYLSRTDGIPSGLIKEKYQARSCQKGQICPLATSKIFSYVGEIYIHDRAETSCIASNVAYTRSLMSALGVISKKLTEQGLVKESGNMLVAKNGANLPPAIDLNPNGNPSEAIKRLNELTTCITPRSLQGYLSLLSVAENKERLLLVSAAAFKYIDLISKTDLVVTVKVKDRAAVNKMKKVSLTKGHRPKYYEIEAAVDLGDFIGMLQEAYEENSNQLIDISAIENAQLSKAMDLMFKGSAWSASVKLPNGEKLCKHLGTQMKEYERFKSLNLANCDYPVNSSSGNGSTQSLRIF